jgi:hypothetical protein
MKIATSASTENGSLPAGLDEDVLIFVSANSTSRVSTVECMESEPSSDVVLGLCAHHGLPAEAAARLLPSAEHSPYDCSLPPEANGRIWILDLSRSHKWLSTARWY